MPNTWFKITGHNGCIFPCHGRPVIKTKPGKVPLEADDMPVYLKCSECGYTPGSNNQPQLVMKFLQYYLKHNRPEGRLTYF